ncbi:MAG: hypothetical protein KZQ60_04030 [Candidatus Thiodiazotropha sp. (ex Lucinoma aequizonata)]|nr:hypothetical protein [Candidatus Thiodiazotropha sp. (ex Lucinoma aequizonata)]
MHYSIMTAAMTLRRLGCALCMPFISPFRPYNRAYAYRGLTAFAPLSMAVSDCEKQQDSWLSCIEFTGIDDAGQTAIKTYIDQAVEHH